MMFCIPKDGLTVFRLCLTRVQREVKSEELKLAKFVAGYVQILLCKDSIRSKGLISDISPLERTVTVREKHLVSLMYFAQQSEWSAVLNFHGSVLRGLVAWEILSYIWRTDALWAPLAGKLADFVFSNACFILSRLPARTMH